MQVYVVHYSPDAYDAGMEVIESAWLVEEDARKRVKELEESKSVHIHYHYVTYDAVEVK
jgi:hypothetical protein